MATLTEEQKRRATKELGMKGMKPTSVDIAEQAAVGAYNDDTSRPAGRAADDLGAKRSMGERKAPAGSREAAAEQTAKEKKERKLTPQEVDEWRRTGKLPKR